MHDKLYRECCLLTLEMSQAALLNPKMTQAARETSTEHGQALPPMPAQKTKSAKDREARERINKLKSAITLSTVRELDGVGFYHTINTRQIQRLLVKDQEVHGLEELGEDLRAILDTFQNEEWGEALQK